MPDSVIIAPLKSIVGTSPRYVVALVENASPSIEQVIPD